MRAFIFAIGGTGSRVLNAMIMQLAAGVRPKTQGGQVIDSIVPIIIDPHAENAGLQELTRLLDYYRTIRQRIHGNLETRQTDGFFSVKIETLKDAEPKITRGDKFYFKMNNVSTQTFSQFIKESDMSLETRHLTDILYSEDEMATNMKEGFYGSPNIGCVALNEFANSEDFKAFCQAYNEGDKLFFIGSIFGGTGASGLPLFVSSIRDLASKENENDVRGACANAPIGALVVMPYFSITPDQDSPIKEQDWIIKSRSALSYYETNLNRMINDIYYIADPQGTASFENDPGNVDNQKGNKAHLVELIGAHAIFRFLESGNVGVEKDDDGRIIAGVTHYYQYGLVNDLSHISFNGLHTKTLEVAEKPMMEFHLLRYFMEHSLKDQLGKPYAKGYEPNLDSNVLSREVKEFFQYYDEWIKEMKSHGETAHNLDLFAPYEKGKYTDLFRDIHTKKGFFGRKSVDDNDVCNCLNKAAEIHGNKAGESADRRWFVIAHEALKELIDNNYDLIQ